MRKAGVEERFFAKTIKTDGCWLWTGAGSVNGYGAMEVECARKQATHVSFFLAHGRWPMDGLYILHSCDNPTCVNPTHLREGTQSENLKDAYARNRINKAAVGAKITKTVLAKTHCRKGHPYILGFRSGRNRCRTCLENRGRISRLPMGAEVQYG